MQLTQAFVGRETEIAALGESFGAVAGGTPEVLVIEGDGGIGKTTLAERFLALHPEARVLRANSYLRRAGLTPSAPGTRRGADRAKATAISAAEKAKAAVRRR